MFRHAGGRLGHRPILRTGTFFEQKHPTSNIAAGGKNRVTERLQPGHRFTAERKSNDLMQRRGEEKRDAERKVHPKSCPAT
jgi:hypothetical protein